MREHRVVKIVEILVFAAIFVAGFGSAVWQLWNLLMPKIFSLPTIGFWQALGLLSLSWLLFGGFRGPFRMGARRGYGPGMRGRWSKMTPEEREQFRQGLRSRCGHRDPVAEAPKA